LIREILYNVAIDFRGHTTSVIENETRVWSAGGMVVTGDSRSTRRWFFKNFSSYRLYRGSVPGLLGEGLTSNRLRRDAF